MEMQWVYDIVSDKKGKVVATCIHPEGDEHPSCLIHDKITLVLEGFNLACSLPHPTLKEAQEAMWRTCAPLFTKGLD
jgi:hypothetical protein